MPSEVSRLEKELRFIQEDIEDILHATNLNLDALKVQTLQLPDPSTALPLLSACKNDLQQLQRAIQQRANARLAYLITEQIKQEQSKVRRERLFEYEERIFEQRRLLADKELFYEVLLRPKPKRGNLTAEEFHRLRVEENALREQASFSKLEEELQHYQRMEDHFELQNTFIEECLQKLKAADLSHQQLESIVEAIRVNPVLYDHVSRSQFTKQNLQTTSKFIETVCELTKSQQQYRKQFLEDREMHNFLKWENNKLRSQYQEKEKDRIQQQIAWKNNLSSICRPFKRSVSL